MEKSNCVVCGNPFNFRKGKVYCSDSCKTKAHTMRKAGEPITGNTQRPKGTAPDFDLAEYNEVKALCKNFLMPFDSYCYFRKNLPANVEVKKIADILDDYWSAGKFDDNGNPDADGGFAASYKEFQKNFFAGTFVIIDSSTVAA